MTASREWQDTQSRPFVAKHMFAKAVWRAWHRWRTGVEKRTWIVAPGPSAFMSVMRAIRPGDTVVCLPGHHETVEPVTLVSGTTLWGEL